MSAVLHDVLEDTAVTIEDLIAEGFPPVAIEAITALTKLPGETRLAAAHRAAANPIAAKIAQRAKNVQVRFKPLLVVLLGSVEQPRLIYLHFLVFCLGRCLVAHNRLGARRSMRRFHVRDTRTARLVLIQIPF
jgi:hypothetical protein